MTESLAAFEDISAAVVCAVLFVYFVVVNIRFWYLSNEISDIHDWLRESRADKQPGPSKAE